MNMITQTIVSAVISQVVGNNPAQAQMVKSLASMFLKPNANGGNGLAAIVSQFQKGGLDDVVASWIGTGANKDVSPAQIQQALAPEQMNEIAAQAGVQPADAPNMLAKVLPELINQLTPNGKMDNDMIGQVLNAFLNNNKNAA